MGCDATLKLSRLFAPFLDVLRNLPHGEPLLPLVPVPCIVAASRTVDAQEACETASAQCPLEHLQCVLSELLVRHFRYGALSFMGHGVNPLLQFTGFQL